MNLFLTYFKMGIEHILDTNGYDHMLFVIVLCAVYNLSEWKRIGILITAFTTGHSVTLALSALKIIFADHRIIEVLIPFTILFASLSNLFYRSPEKNRNGWTGYGMALGFGFIHGMGFSAFFNAMMGDSMDIVFPLFSFNLGLEIGQLAIVVLFFGVYFITRSIHNVHQRYWMTFFSGIGAVASVLMILERI